MACQQDMIEKNREFIRYILAKGSSPKNSNPEDRKFMKLYYLINY